MDVQLLTQDPPINTYGKQVPSQATMCTSIRLIFTTPSITYAYFYATQRCRLLCCLHKVWYLCQELI